MAIFQSHFYIEKVKYWLRQLEKPIDGIGNKPLALRGVVTTLADATDFCYDQEQMDIHAVKKKNIR